MKLYKLIFVFILGFTLSACANDKVVKDHDTNLMWQDNIIISKYWLTKENYDLEKYMDTSGDTATLYCQTLSLAGYKDWRLPTETELTSLVNESKENPSIKEGFTNTNSDFYWTADTPVMEQGEIIIKGKIPSGNPFAFMARGVYFSNGKHGAADKYSSQNVRCVRLLTN